MTQARKLKKQIRSRARKTGESYTAARRQVLMQRSRISAPRPAPAPAADVPASLQNVGEDHGVDGWYAQEITVAYERARGLRATNQRMSGEYEVSVSKILPAPVGEVVAALRTPKRRAAWAKAMDPELRQALEAALAGPKGLRLRDKGDARMRFRTPRGVTILLSLDPRAKGRSALVATNMKLKAKADVERCRAAWRPALEALSRHLGG